jgi:hypothetical protein
MFIYILICNKNFSIFFFSQHKVYNHSAIKELLKKLIWAETTTEKGKLAAAEINPLQADKSLKAVLKS